jgi:hypothetical protein
LAREDEQMGSGAEYCGERQNCADFDPELKDGSFSYLQFAPVPPGCVADIPSYEQAQ